ncbi:MAG: methyltransferase FkbM [Planctomycetaceae bacterium]|nr:methyltransferase FkbM [Planctomycetaceae bacterium]
MNLFEKMHYLHRAYRYRYRSERQELACLIKQDLNGATVVDAGANRGAWTWWMHKKVGPRGNVIAFEPQPELGEYLSQVKSDFRLRRLTVVNKGLSSQSGRQLMVRPRAHWVGGSLELSPDYPDSDTFMVDLTSLDEYFAEHANLRPVRFMKCDIQDHEYQCFLGAKEVLSEDLPAVLFECTDPEQEETRIFPFLRSLGYDGFFIHNRSIRPIEELSQQRGMIDRAYFNCLFVSSQQNADLRIHKAA